MTMDTAVAHYFPPRQSFLFEEPLTVLPVTLSLVQQRCAECNHKPLVDT